LHLILDGKELGIMSKGFSRRGFIKRSAAAAGVAAMARVSSGPFVLAQQPPGDKLRVAVIGVAGMGGYSVAAALREKLVAMADVDEKNIAKVMRDSVKETAKPKIYFTDAGGPLTAIALTGHLAQYCGIGGKVEWDVEKMQCTNKPELNKFVRREYRSGWEVC
jgi:hypothetical protein